MLERALRTPTNSLSKKHPKQEGVPQGLSIANILADVYLKDLDRILNKRKVFYGRFVDDIVISGKKIPLFHAVAVLHIWLFFNGLRLGKEKSSYGRVTEGIDYLGYNVKKTSSDKVYVGVRKSSQQNLINSLCGLFTAYIKTEKIKHIYRLNRRITGVIWQGKRYGWLFYFLELNDLSILKKFDSIVSKQKKRYNLKEKSLKKFTNSFWRIKKNKLGQYITNFDNYSIDEMKSYLQTSLEKELEELNKYSEAQIRRMFKHEVQKEVDKMELDIGDIS